MGHARPTPLPAHTRRREPLPLQSAPWTSESDPQEVLSVCASRVCPYTRPHLGRVPSRGVLVDPAYCSVPTLRNGSCRGKETLCLEVVTTTGRTTKGACVCV